MKRNAPNKEDLNSAWAIARVWKELLCLLFADWKAAGRWRLALVNFFDPVHGFFIDTQMRTVFLGRRYCTCTACMTRVMCHAATRSEDHTEAWFGRMMRTCRKLYSVGRDSDGIAVARIARWEVGRRSDVHLARWSEPVLEIRVDAKGRVALVPYEANAVSMRTRARA